MTTAVGSEAEEDADVNPRQERPAARRRRSTERRGNDAEAAFERLEAAKKAAAELAAQEAQTATTEDVQPPSGGGSAWPGKVKLAELADNPENPRETLRELDGLAATIAERGLLQDIVITARDVFLEAYPELRDAEPLPGRPQLLEAEYVILHGHRRVHAALLAGLEELPAKLRDSAWFNDGDSLIENIQREDLDPLDEARGIEQMMKRRSINAKQAAAQLGKSEGWVSQRRALLSLRPDLQDALKDGRLKIEDARRIAKLPASQQAMPEPPAPKKAVAEETGKKESAPGGEKVQTRTVIIKLGNPVELANDLRSQLSPEDLETLVRLLTETTAH